VNVFRSIARDVMDLANRVAVKAPADLPSGSLAAVRQQRVAPVLQTSRFRDAFEQFPQGARGTLGTLSAERAFRPQFSAAPGRSLQTDGFERATRRGVDLSGGLKASSKAESKADPISAGVASNGFNASLDDLDSLLG
jgi:hypothetical protein